MHFIERMYERHGVHVSEMDVPDMIRQVEWVIANRPDTVVDVQPDGRVLVVTNLGTYGRFPVIYDPAKRELRTVFTWGMLRRYDPQVVKDKHEQLRQAATSPEVENLP